MKNYFIIAILTIILNTNAYSDHKIEEQNFTGVSYKVQGGDNYQKLETELVDNKLSQYVQKQLDNRDKTGLINYLLYENGKIVIISSIASFTLPAFFGGYAASKVAVRRLADSWRGYLKKYNSIHEREIEFYPDKMSFVGLDKIIKN